MVSKKLNPQAKVIGILLTRFNPRFNAMKVMREVTEKFSAYFEAPVYDTFIRQSVAVMECQMESVDLFDAPKQSAAIADYRAFVAEFLHNESRNTNTRFPPAPDHSDRASDEGTYSCHRILRHWYKLF